MVWLIGCNGMLGTDVKKSLRDNRINYIESDIEINITDYDTLKKFIKGTKISWIINCSAYTAVDRAEDEEKLAYKINALGVLYIAKISAETKAKLIHISTDYVFDGQKIGAYLETDKTNPIGVYGRTKLAGEKNIIENLENYFIIRTAWLYGKWGNNFIKTMLRLFTEHDQVKVVNDQYGTPTYTKDLAELIITIIKQDSNNYGIYHFTNLGRITWYDLALEIYNKALQKKMLSKKVNILPITTKEFPTKAKRPKNSFLSKEKVQHVFNIKIRPWQESLDSFLEELKIKS